jgi:SPP1 family predicted phage head-tail adaptor
MIGHLLNRTVEVWRRAETDDGTGGQATTWVQTGTHRVRISQPSAQERQVAQQAHSDLTHKVYAQPGTDIRRGDELREAGLTLRVTATVGPSKDIYLRADCEQLQSEGS